MSEEKTKEEILAEQDAQQAPPPSFVPLSPGAIEGALADVKKAKPKAEPDDEDILVKGIDSDFWRVLKNRILMYADNVDEMLLGKVATMQTLNPQDVGFRYLLNSQITNALRDIVRLVENTAEVVKEVIEDEQKEKEEQKS